jgi:hypothetical protein
VIGDTLRHPDDRAVKDAARERVRALMQRFPVYP